MPVDEDDDLCRPVERDLEEETAMPASRHSAAVHIDGPS